MRKDEEAFYIDDDALHMEIYNKRIFAVFNIIMCSTRNAAKEKRSRSYNVLYYSLKLQYTAGTSNNVVIVVLVIKQRVADEIIAEISYSWMGSSLGGAY